MYVCMYVCMFVYVYMQVCMYLSLCPMHVQSGHGMPLLSVIRQPCYDFTDAHSPTNAIPDGPLPWA